MLALKMVLMIAGVLMLTAAVGVPIYGMWLRYITARRWEMEEAATGEVHKHEEKEIAWRGPFALGMVALLPLLISASIVVVPSGMGGVRISQIGGTEPGTLYPGLHFVTPM